MDQIKRILLVRGQPGDASNIERSLNGTEGGYEVLYASDFEAGRETLARGEADLVLLDQGEANGTALEELAGLRLQAPSTPVVVLTDIVDDTYAANVVRRGAQDCLVKSRVNGGVIARVVRDALERSRILTRLLELDELKSKFVSTVSHEMRTPMAIIREFVSLVRDGVTGEVSNDQVECLDAALRNCDRLTALIEDLLDLSLIESGKLKLRRVRTELAPLLHHCTVDFSHKCQAKGQRLVVDVGENLPPFLGDRDKVQQVVVNLLENAHKFNPEGVCITLRSTTSDDRLSIEVQDDGVGITEEDQVRVFDAFTQIERRDGPGAQGTGLGLAISRSIVQLHGGDMSLESRPGSGSCFRFTLPIYQEGAELAAFVEDLRRSYEARRKSASLVLIRRRGSESDQDSGDAHEIERLRQLEQVAQATLRRRRDECMLVESRRLLACVLESGPEGGRIALRRLASGLSEAGMTIADVEFTLERLEALDCWSGPDDASRHFEPLETILETDGIAAVC